MVKENGEYFIEYIPWTPVEHLELCNDEYGFQYYSDYLTYEISTTKRLIVDHNYNTVETDVEKRPTNGIILSEVSIGHIPAAEQKISDFKDVEFIKKKLDNAFYIAQSENSFILEDIYFTSNDVECFYYVSGNRDYSDISRVEQLCVWGSDGEKVEKIETIDMQLDEWGEGFWFEDCEIYQFGKSNHFYVGIGGVGYWVQHKYCFENEEFKLLDSTLYFQKSEDGQVTTECMLPIEALDGEIICLSLQSTEIFYSEGTYVEYGVEEIDVSELRQYDNYEEMISKAEQEVLQLHYFGDMYAVCGGIIPETSELKQVLVSANDKIYLNYAVYSGVAEISNENRPNIWAQVILKASSNKLEFVDVKFGRKKNGGGVSWGDELGLPLYYGVGKELEYRESE